ncbi:bicoid stability factor isoform X2 [Ptiloglossa arizonensis]|uniref:bicoid stability factor isoform X2 n=1 Tax=Ptiloglossa arizonensis TaxID=3350558 RepID=UPI003F9FB450
MISIFFRCMNKFGQCPQNVILNKQKKLRNFIIEGKNDSLYILIRNKSSTLDTQRKTNKYLFVNKKFHEIENDILTYKWIQKSKIENILSNIQCADDINSSEVISLLGWCNNIIECKPLERLGLAIYMWNFFDICNIPMTSIHYNKLIEIYLKNDYTFSPLELLQEMTDKNIYPNMNIYENCIKYYCMQGNINNALLLVKIMKENKFPVTKVIYNSLITGYSYTDDIENVNKTLIRMKMNNIQPNVETYITVINAYARKNDIIKVKEIMHSCNASNIRFSNMNILNVIYTLVKNNHMEYVDSMYQYIKESSSCFPDEIELLLKLININQINVVKNILLHYKVIHSNIAKLILQMIVHISMEPEQIISMCNFMENKKMCENSLLCALYYSYFKDDDDISFSLLRKCNLYYTIKAHYFWPLLVKKANKYDFKGILNILKIMINEFNVSPCIDTIAKYVLPYSFGNEHGIKRLLINHNVNEIIFDNAYVLFLLQTWRLKNVITYMKIYPNYYLYTVIAHDLRSQIILHLVKEEVTITDQTASKIKYFLKDYQNKDVMLALDAISNKMA